MGADMYVDLEYDDGDDESTIILQDSLVIIASRLLHDDLDSADDVYAYCGVCCCDVDGGDSDGVLGNAEIDAECE